MSRQIKITVTRRNGVFIARCHGYTVRSQGYHEVDLTWAVKKMALRIKLWPAETVDAADWEREKEKITIIPPTAERDPIAAALDHLLHDAQARQVWAAEWKIEQRFEGYKHSESGKLLWTGYVNVWDRLCLEKYDPQKEIELLSSPSVKMLFRGIQADDEAEAIKEAERRREEKLGSRTFGFKDEQD